jgi:hypothetical protein
MAIGHKHLEARGLIVDTLRTNSPIFGEPKLL